MKFGPAPIAQAEGAILAHSIAIEGGRLRKGRVLEPDDLSALTEAGHAEVTIARLEPGDVSEDDAARRLAQALVPDPEAAHLTIGPAVTGRCNLLAAGPGVAGIDAAAIHAVNAIDPMMTVATVPPWQRMEDGGMAATVKIISYAVPGDKLDSACEAARGAMRLYPPRIGTAALIETGQPRSDKARRAIGGKLETLDVALDDYETVPHEIGSLSDAIRRSEAEMILILTATATSDPQDTAPEALRRAGGTVAHVGMPVDPGNLLFLGRLGDRPVIGLPGCARSPALNGADWVLERIACGIDVRPADIAAMGVGGLLKEVPARGQPRRGGAKA